MKILITGVAGLLGSNLAHYLLTKYDDVEIVGVDDLSGGYRENLPTHPRFEFIGHKLGHKSRDFQLTGTLDCEFDYVYHFAAYAAEGLSPFMRVFNYENNCGSTAEVINFCIERKVKRLVYTSSMSVYGHGLQPNTQSYKFEETDPCSPIDPYGVSKMACELDIKIAGEQHGLDWCIIRPHNIFGPRQNIWDRYRNVLGIWMWQILHGEPMLIYGNGEQVRAFTYIDNDLQCFYNAAVLPEASREIINVGGIIPHTINEMADMVRRVAGKPDYPIVHMEKRHEVFKAVPTYYKSIELLGYKDTVDLETGLKYMWQWAKTQPDHKRKKWDEYEVNTGLYQYWR
jgi:UDP-glucose 4-epimerase